ncbi:MAG: acetyl-CoA carboxylase biotin carboxyl carrier protein [Nitrospirota bacterium]|jgi:acetyl-CoA carboxylase biotin carboxyl carrier protein
MMELEDLKELINFLKNTDITEVFIETKGTKVRLRREHLLGQPAPRPEGAVGHGEAAAEAIAAPAEEDESHRLITVTAPLVGTFYRAPSPEAAPFVEVGDTVKKGQVICIIEAMKLMNEIESEADGVVARVLVENSHPVEYGEPLFLLEPLQ